MSDRNGMAQGLTPEQQEFARQAILSVRKRVRDGAFRAPPEVPEKRESIVPGMEVVVPASGPPVPIPGLDKEDGEND
jgi:hypothetical protein